MDSQYTLAFNEKTNYFPCFYSFRPYVFGIYGTVMLTSAGIDVSTNPDEYKLFEHIGGAECIWYGDYMGNSGWVC